MAKTEKEIKKMAYDLAKETSQLTGDINILLLDMIKFTNGVNLTQESVIKRLETIKSKCEDIFKETTDEVFESKF